MNSIGLFLIIVGHLISTSFAASENPYDDSPWLKLETTAPWERNIVGVELIPVEAKLEEDLAAIMGHSFIRLVDDGPASENWTFGFTGYYWDDEKNYFRSSDALSGLGMINPYPLITEFKQLSKITHEYNHKQNRFMQRYIIPMNQQQIEKLKVVIKKYHELSVNRQLGGYRFIDKNCSSEIVQILFEALDITPHFLFIIQKQKFVTPFSISKVFKQFGLVLPRAGIIDTELTSDPIGLDMNWRPFNKLYSWCQTPADPKCRSEWLEEASERLGGGWLKDLQRYFKKKAYLKTAGEEMIQEVNQIYLELKGDHSF